MNDPHAETKAILPPTEYHPDLPLANARIAELVSALEVCHRSRRAMVETASRLRAEMAKLRQLNSQMEAEIARLRPATDARIHIRPQERTDG